MNALKAKRKEPFATSRLPKDVMARFMLRASVEDNVQKKIDEYETKRQEELSAIAQTVDATWLYALHVEKGYGRKRLRHMWETAIRTRIAIRSFYRDGDSAYVEQETGRNVEDFAIAAELLKIGVDIEAWESENIIIDKETGNVRFVPQAKIEED